VLNAAPPPQVHAPPPPPPSLRARVETTLACARSTCKPPPTASSCTAARRTFQPQLSAPRRTATSLRAAAGAAAAPPLAATMVPPATNGGGLVMSAPSSAAEQVANAAPTPTAPLKKQQQLHATRVLRVDADLLEAACAAATTERYALPSAVDLHTNSSSSSTTISNAGSDLNAALRVLHEAGELLRAGQLVGLPTETVYGLAANALDAAAVARIFEAKGRPADNPLIVHVSDMQMLYSLYPGGG